MKILIIHSYYRLRGGEDTVVEQESDLLNNGNEVKVLTFMNREGVRGGFQFLCSIWNIIVARKVKYAIDSFQPNVIHLHNWHFALGPIVIRTAQKGKVPLVLTIHNYRLLCPSATLMYRGKLFLESISKNFPWAAISHRVYRNSYFLTFWLAFIVWVHKKLGTWHMVSKFIVLTEFSKDLMIRSSLGISEDKVVVKANFVHRSKIKTSSHRKHFLFIGRLSEEKGIHILLKAFMKTGQTLHIAGDGPLKNMILKATQGTTNIQYLGLLSKREITEALQSCTALIFPSIWFEGLPITILEAFSADVPVIASNIGAMSSLIQHGNNGLHFNVGDACDLAKTTIRWEKFSSQTQSKFRLAARATYENNYTASKNFKMLMTLYNQVIKENHYIN